MIRISKNNFALVLIILLSVFLNFYKLPELPRGFHIDDEFAEEDILFIDSAMCDLQKGIKEVDSIVDKKNNTYFKIRQAKLTI